MCGIAGFLAPSPLGPDAESIVRAMGSRLSHRGPDGSGQWQDPEAGIALAHRRLAIVDLTSAGHQPMASVDGRWVISFNGEIYNHTALRRELEGEGRAPVWQGHSDTETLLAAIAAWGVEKAIRWSVGMFAIALWDRRERVLSLVRDRMGEKPLYYGTQGGVLLFGSELKALRAHPSYQDRIDRGALGLLLRHGYIPEPWTINEEIFKLPPGTILRVRTPMDAKRDAEPYWSVANSALAGARTSEYLNDSEAVDALDGLLRQSIEGQRMADVPIGAFLSGGIDSSATVAIMQALSPVPVRTFTIGVPDSALDESTQARAVAEYLGTCHTELVVTPEEALRTIPDLARIYCEPFADPSQIPTYLVSRLARSEVTVALSGDGGDELFGGYDRYRWARGVAAVPVQIRRAVGAILRTMPAEAWSRLLDPVAPLLPSELRHPGRADRLRKLSVLLRAPSDDAIYTEIVSFWSKATTPVIGAVDRVTSFAKPQPELTDFTARMMLLDLCTYLPDDILVKVDRAAMAVSLETRIPLLDHRIVEFSHRLPLHQRVRGGKSKWVLRELLNRYVPHALVDRPKKGFGVPIHDWLRGPLRGWADDLLSEDRLRRADFIDWKPVRCLWQEHLSGKGDWGYRLWPILMFESWRDAQTGMNQEARGR